MSTAEFCPMKNIEKLLLAIGYEKVIVFEKKRRVYRFPPIVQLQKSLVKKWWAVIRTAHLYYGS